VAAHVHNRGVKRLQVGPVRRKCGKGSIAYTRDDGVAVIPMAALGA
jgi:hypothetical protein